MYYHFILYSFIYTYGIFFFINVDIRTNLRATDSEINDHVSFQWP